MKESKEYYSLITMEPIAIRGDYKTRMVWIDNKVLKPKYSQNVFNHSPKGFDWGSFGPGTAQLALAILLELTKNKKISMILHHLFKNEYLSPLPESDFEIIVDVAIV